MVSALSKLANPWKCDAPGCGQLRAKDANHWMVIGVSGFLHPWPTICISPWEEELAAIPDARHACGIDCALKIIGALQNMLKEHFFTRRGGSPSAPATVVLPVADFDLKGR